MQNLIEGYIMRTAGDTRQLNIFQLYRDIQAEKIKMYQDSMDVTASGESRYDYIDQWVFENADVYLNLHYLAVMSWIGRDADLSVTITDDTGDCLSTLKMEAPAKQATLSAVYRMSKEFVKDAIRTVKLDYPSAALHECEFKVTIDGCEHSSGRIDARRVIKTIFAL